MTDFAEDADYFANLEIHMVDDVASDLEVRQAEADSAQVSAPEAAPWPLDAGPSEPF